MSVPSHATDSDGVVDWVIVLFAVKLVDGQTARDGVVMVEDTGIWGPVCGVGFGENEASE